MKSTSEKSEYPNGWKPIIVSRSLEARDLNRLYYPSSTGSSVSASQENWKWTSNGRTDRTHTRAPTLDDIDSTRTFSLRNGLFFATDNFKNQPVSSTSDSPFPQAKNPNNGEPKRKEKIVLREDDIMWMHYGPSGGQPIPKFRPFGSSSRAKMRHIPGRENNGNLNPGTQVERRTINIKDEGNLFDYSTKPTVDETKVESTTESLDSRTRLRVADTSPRNSPSLAFQSTDENRFQPMPSHNKRHTTRSWQADNELSKPTDRYDHNYDQQTSESESDGATSDKDDTWQSLYHDTFGKAAAPSDDAVENLSPRRGYEHAPSKFNVRNVGGFVDNIDGDVRKAENTSTMKIEGENERRRGNKSEDGVHKQNRKLASNSAKLENISQDDSWTWIAKAGQQIKTVDDKRKRKSGKFFAKPIVITEPETTRLTAEYYRQLFDSFGGSRNEGEGDYKTTTSWRFGSSSNKKNLQNNSAVATTQKIERYDGKIPESGWFGIGGDKLVSRTNVSSQPASAPLTSGAKVNCTEKDAGNCDNTETGNRQDEENVNSESKEDEAWSFFFNFTGIQFTDLLPKTLKANIFLVKRLLVECYSDFDSEHNFNGNTVNCLKKITFKVLDKAVNSDVVKITDMVSLVKENRTAIEQLGSR